MPDIFHKVAGAWKKTSALSVKVAGAWKNVPSAWVKVAGAWKLVYSAGGGAIDMGDIANSVRWRSVTNAYMRKTFVAPTTQNTFTLSLWAKRAKLTVLQYLFGAGTNHSLGFTAADNLALTIAGTAAITSAGKFRDPTAWMHVLLRQNSGGCEVFVNGVSIGTTATVSAVFNSAVAHDLGALNGTLASLFSGYLSRVCFLDGQYLAPAAFAQANSEGTWVTKSQAAIKALADGAGNNNCMLEFDTAAALANLGNDFSDNNNDWTVNAGFSITAGTDYDWMTDSPSNNYALPNWLNLHASTGTNTLSNANLTHTATTTGGGYYGGTVAVKSGKWYVEIVAAPGTFEGADNIIGASHINPSKAAIAASNVYLRGIVNPANVSEIIKNGVVVQSGLLEISNNDVIAVALDLDNLTAQFYRNGIALGAQVTGLAAGTWQLLTEAKGVGSGSTYHANFGQRPFAHTPPSGFLPMCAANTVEEAITMSGSFTGNANADGPFVWLGGVPETMTINGNAVTWGTHADKTAGGFKLRTAATTHNLSGTNNYVVTVAGQQFKYANAQANP